jgi:predicted RecB family nuclease
MLQKFNWIIDSMPVTPRLITKQHFLNSLICPTLAWRAIRETASSSPSAGDLLRMSEGKRIGEAARRQYTDGVLVSEVTSELAVQKTVDLLNDQNVTVIFEATFQVGRFIAKADVLVRGELGWNLIEVKSGINDKQDYVLDLAYTAFVMTQAGQPPATASLQLINRDYRLGQPEPNLLAKPVDKTNEVHLLVAHYIKVAPSIEESLFAETAPAPKLIKACKSCPYFDTDCHGKGIDHHVIHLPRLTTKMLDDLAAKNVHRIADIPDDYRLNRSHAIVKQVVRQGMPHYDASAIRQALNEIEWPVAYLDFETMQTALPRFHAVAPYEQMVTQFSIHLCDKPGSIIGHVDFLAATERDSRADLLQQLLQHTAAARTIVVYSSFEMSVLNRLADLYPECTKSIEDCIKKLFDLLTVLKPRNYYHADLKGSYSIKSVLPVLMPGYSYEHLFIQNGSDAVAMFVKVVDGKCTPEEAAVIRRDLLEYCKLDTLAMVKLHEQLEHLASEPS